MEDSELKELYEDGKTEALRLFKKTAVGNVSDNYLQELKMKMKSKYQQVKEENEMESNNSCHNFLSQAYVFIERKLKNKEF